MQTVKTTPLTSLSSASTTSSHHTSQSQTHNSMEKTDDYNDLVRVLKKEIDEEKEDSSCFLTAALLRFVRMEQRKESNDILRSVFIKMFNELTPAHLNVITELAQEPSLFPAFYNTKIEKFLDDLGIGTEERVRLL